MWHYSSLINRWHLYLYLEPGWTFATFLPKEHGESDSISDRKGWHSFFLALRLRTLFLGLSCRRVKKPRPYGEATCKRSSWQSQLWFQTTGRISTRCVNETALETRQPQPPPDTNYLRALERWPPRWAQSTPRTMKDDNKKSLWSFCTTKLEVACLAAIDIWNILM